MPQLQEAVQIAPENITLATHTPQKKSQVVSEAITDAEAKAFIYQHESGNNPAAVNKSSGALGLGQSLPASKLTNVCPDLSYSCQDAFFTNYAITRYGGWIQAYDHWIKFRWW